MLNDFSIEMQFLLCVLAVWRITHFFVAEDGPWDIVIKIRAKLGDSVAGQIMDCFYCASIWISIPFCFVLTNNILNILILLFALSGAAALLEQFTNNNTGKKS
jgi:hypothetical protein